MKEQWSAFFNLLMSLRESPTSNEIFIEDGQIILGMITMMRVAIKMIMVTMIMIRFNMIITRMMMMM